MIELSAETLAAAKNNDISAVAAVVAATEDLVMSRARRVAGSDVASVDDYAQAGRMAVWEGIKRFEGETLAEFVAFIGRSIFGAMADARREEMMRGVSPHAAKVFGEALAQAAGDPYEAEQIAASEAMGKDRLSRELAFAARLSWAGMDSLDRPFNVDITGESVSLGDVVAREIEMPADLVEPRDVAAHRRKVVRERVHLALGRLSERQRTVLKAGYGIAPLALYRVAVDDSELAAELGATPAQVQMARYRGGLRFAEVYTEGAREC
ncbi:MULTISPECIES: sigma-70 family RNA polymerase sigma factor [unclassified Kitasatospora]|uniref:sigma-70 family RNA polymerase sigma factor n=1 Tax=unclassified Kitasatospora TaxID=2633591 RepID=UPI0033C5A048